MSTGYVHETAFYRDDVELAAIVAPFLAGGLAAGEPTLVALDERRAGVVAGALDDSSGITFLPASAYTRPASTIRDLQRRFRALVADGATRIRVVGGVPHPGEGASWEPWRRYEAAANVAFAELPLWGLCPYDLRTTSAAVLDDVVRTHRHVATTDGQHLPNERYEDPVEFLVRAPAAPLDPLELTPSDVQLWDPSPRQARQAVAELDPGAVPPSAVEDLITSVSEIVTNAHLHGRPPILLRAWSSPDRLVVRVVDAGPGVDDPFAGLLPLDRSSGSGGRGLWIASQLCSQVVLQRTAAGFAVRLVAGTPHPA